MSKVICDICGTSYPETAEQCPICGSTREAVEETDSDVIIPVEVPRRSSDTRSKGGRFSTSNVRKRNQGNVKYTAPVNDDAPEDEYEDDDVYRGYEEHSDEQQANPFLVVLLILVIAALLVATGYIFVRYFLPNMQDNPEITTVTTESTEAEPSTDDTTEELQIPCTSLVLTSGGTVELNKEGANWLLNVITLPEDTTDQLTYASSDETVATVSESGRITAVSEGEAVITISCGEKKMECTVICRFGEDTSTEGTEEATEGTEETEAPTETTKPLLDITLKLNLTDLTLSFVGDTYTLKVNSELSAEDVTWTSEDPEIATVENGAVVAVKRGYHQCVCRIRRPEGGVYHPL